MRVENRQGPAIISVENQSTTQSQRTGRANHLNQRKQSIHDCKLTINVVCCEDSPEKFSQIVQAELDDALLDEPLLESAEQQVAAGEARGLHNAAHHEEHGPVTYLQQVHEGGFTVLFGGPDSQQETFFGAGSYVAFIDDEGPGHGSKVGPEGVKRTLRVLKGHIIN